MFDNLASIDPVFFIVKAYVHLSPGFDNNDSAIDTDESSTVATPQEKPVFDVLDVIAFTVPLLKATFQD